ncbi:acyltransferase [Streptomyces scopuliridis]|uniref:Acyltransferase n=1 Tax=Streptomyces scopuliridis TaxID=452529 RepID=A0ACD4ZMX8_9ACTN|nr:acyltransferase [Streptomyces scopuliridis]WSB99827.1 acyltransferase [Streptomyces scopuliridis]WSC06474.1 acyltransferase [Streptomyces scopuliridis]
MTTHSVAPVSEAPATSGRDRYLDLLRAVALVRVVVFHVFGWAWLTILFPSMGVMFALAGSLMARSLSKRPPWSVIRGRLRRLLPPMWVFALVVVPVMFVLGWQPAREEGAWWFAELANYLVPLGAPPYPFESGDAGGLLDTTWADEAAGPLWYIRTYLWFVLASPLLLWAFRRLPWATLLFPVALTAVIGTGLVEIPGETGAALTDFAVYGACWVLGFAHQDGMFRRVPRYLTVSLAALTMACALWWASGHLTDEGWNLDEIPLAQAAWSLGFCAILLQYAPSWRRLPGRLARYDALITLANNRAVTIYLWHNLLIMATVPLLDQLWNIPGIDAFGTALDAASTTLTLLLVWPLIALMILAVGWIEDVAARRAPRLWPAGAPSVSATTSPVG